MSSREELKAEVLKRFTTKEGRSAARLTIQLVDALFDGIKDLQGRVRYLEAGTVADCFKGGYMPGMTYERGSLTQKSGGLYLAMRETEATPGSSDDWRLIGKV